MRYQDVEETVEDFWRIHCRRQGSVCVAVSGGSDSVALFHVLHAMRARLSIKKLGIAHVNHRLRNRESDEDETFVRRIAQKADVPFHCKVLDRKDVPRTGIEEWARNARYAFFRQLWKTGGYDYIATAHTAEDQAETIVLRLMRGSGVHGLCGIAPVRDGYIIRPLLHARKDGLRKWLSANRLTFHEDSTNADTSYTRNWVRHKILPLMEKKEPWAVQHLAAVADNARIITELVRPIINKWIDDNVVFIDRNRFFIDKKGFLNDNTAAEGIVSILREKGIGFDHRHVASVLKNQKRRNGTFLLPDGWCYECKKDTVEFSKRKNAGRRGRVRAFRFELLSRGTTVCRERNCQFVVKRYKAGHGPKPSFSDPMVAYLDAGMRGGRLVFRSWKSDERFWPYGAKTDTLLKDFLKKQGIPMKERLGTGVVAQKQGEILWIPGLRICHRVMITPKTKEIMKISCKPFP